MAAWAASVSSDIYIMYMYHALFIKLSLESASGRGAAHFTRHRKVLISKPQINRKQDRIVYLTRRLVATYSGSDLYVDHQKAGRHLSITVGGQAWPKGAQNLLSVMWPPKMSTRTCQNLKLLWLKDNYNNVVIAMKQGVTGASL